MTKLCRKMIHLNIKRRIVWRVSILRRCITSFWNQILACWIGKSIRYSALPRSLRIVSPHNVGVIERTFSSPVDMAAPPCRDLEKDSSSDLVALKISLLGDCEIGKTSFLTKYVGKENVQENFATTGVNQMDKTLCVKGARISYSIWEVAGDDSSTNHMPAACKDSVAMLFMFDLTSRCTLNSVPKWYQQARKCNQNAIPVLVGTKFDEFIQLPLDLQWTIANQARSYAKAINATIFFSSSTYNINVNKIFKFITAKLFNLPWNLERNLTVGEPIIDF